MNYKPHALRESRACEHLGIGRTKFRSLVSNNVLPQPYRSGGCALWKTLELEYAFDAHIGAANDNTRAQAFNSWSDINASVVSKEVKCDD